MYRFADFEQTQIGPDLAIVHLDAPFVINGSTTGFTTNFSTTPPSQQNGKTFSIYGQGDNNDNGTGFGTWRTADLTVSSASNDYLVLSHNSTDQRLLPGDSGGPMFERVNGFRYQVSVNDAISGTDSWVVPLAPYVGWINAVVATNWNITKPVQTFDVFSGEVQGSKWGFTDENVVAWAGPARSASVMCGNRGFVGGYYYGHEIVNSGTYTIACTGPNSTWMDVTTSDIASTGWGFTDTNQVGWGQAARAADTICNSRGYVSGRFNGFQSGDGKYGLFCYDRTRAQHFDATHDELAATGWTVDDTNVTGWAQAGRAAYGYCANRGFTSGFLNGWMGPGVFGVICQK